MTYPDAIEYLFEILTIKSDEKLRIMAKRVLFENDIQINEANIQQSIIALAKHYKDTLIFVN